MSGLLAVALLLLVGSLAGVVARRLRQPAVVFELLVGLALGPTLLGRFAPELAAWFHPADPDSAKLVTLLARSGLLLFVLGSGAEVDRGSLRDDRGLVFPIGAASFVFPLVAGLLVGATTLTEGPDPLARTAFLGIALSVSALPVIARTLSDLGWLGRPFGATILGSVVLSDVLAWASLFTVIVASGRASATTNPARVVADVVLLAFAVGLLLPNRARRFLASDAKTPFGFVRNLGAILYFTSAGLGLDLAASLDLWFVLLVIAVATLSKVLGGFVGARLVGLDARTSLGVGAAVNARGAMEIVIATTGIELGLADERTYGTLILLAIVSSVATAPLLRRIGPDLGLRAARSQAAVATES